MVSISVCIPCIEQHLIYLPDCFKSIHNQTRAPDEVILVVSGISGSSEVKAIIPQLLAEYPEMPIMIDYTTEKKYAGENRNRAVELATSDIVSFMDADDLMCVDRLFVLDQLFNRYKNHVGVLHYFVENRPLSIFPPEDFSTYHVKNYFFSDKLHFGHASFRKKIFQEFSYSAAPRGQDVEFVHNILAKYMNYLLIYQKPLTHYISNHSSFYR